MSSYKPLTIDGELEKLNYRRALPVELLSKGFVYEENPGFFHTKCGSFASIWEFSPFDYGTLSENEMLGVQSGFTSVLRKFLPGSNGQIIRFGTRDIRSVLLRYEEGIDRAWDEMRSQVETEKWWDRHPFSNEFNHSIVEKFNQASQKERGFFADVAADDFDNAIREMAASLEDVELAQSVVQNASADFREGMTPIINRNFLVLIWRPEFVRDGYCSTFWDTLKIPLGLTTARKNREKVYVPAFKFFTKAAKNIEDELKRQNFVPHRLTGDDWRAVVHKILNPRRSGIQPTPPTRRKASLGKLVKGKAFLDKHESLSSALCFGHLHTDGHKITLLEDGHKYYYHATSLKGRIHEIYPGVIQESLANASTEGLFTINFDVEQKEKSLNNLYWRKKIFSWKESSPFGENDEAKTAVKEINDVKDALTTSIVENRISLMNTSVHFLAGNANDRVSRANATLISESLPLSAGITETVRAESILHSCLPLNYSPEVKKYISRDQPYTTQDVADMAPLYCNFQGTESSGFLFHNRAGEPIFIDLWGKNSKTGHALAVGGTGTGKSFTMAYLMASAMARYNPKIWIIDKGRSYESLCEVFDGQYIDICRTPFENANGEIQQPSCLNPFNLGKVDGLYVEPTRDDILDVMNVLCSMLQSSIGGVAVHEVITKSHTTIFQNSLWEFYKYFVKENPGVEPRFSDYIPYLERTNTRDLDGALVAEKLQSFYGDGTYAPLFDGALTIDWKSDFIILETEKMASDDSLKIVTMCLFKQIDTYCKIRLPAFRKKLILVDEAWSTLSDPQAAGALAGFFRELRKYNGACILVSQAVMDFLSVVSAEESGGNVLVK